MSCYIVDLVIHRTLLLKILCMNIKNHNCQINTSFYLLFGVNLICSIIIIINRAFCHCLGLAKPKRVQLWVTLEKINQAKTTKFIYKL